MYMKDFKDVYYQYILKLYLNCTGSEFKNKLWKLMNNDRYFFYTYVYKPFVKIHKDFVEKTGGIFDVFLFPMETVPLYRDYSECAKDFSKITEVSYTKESFIRVFKAQFDFLSVALRLEISKRVRVKYGLQCAPYKVFNYWRDNGEDLTEKVWCKKPVMSWNEKNLIDCLYNLDPERSCSGSCFKASKYFSGYSIDELKEMRKSANIKACFAEYDIPDYLRM